MRKLLKSRRAYFSLLISFLTFLVLSFSYINLDKKYGEFDVKISQRQIELLNTYQNGEKVLMYVDSASKMSMYQSIHQLASQGGYYSEPGCGKYFGYVLWQGFGTAAGAPVREFRRCYPTNSTIRNSLGRFITYNTDRYFDFYERQNRVSIPRNNYDFLIRFRDNKTKVSGIALSQVRQPIQCILGDVQDVVYSSSFLGQWGTEAKCGIYTYKPSFTQEVNYNAGEYGKIVETVESGAIQKIISSCGAVDVDKCLAGNINSLDTPELHWEVDCSSVQEKAFYTFVDAFRKCVESSNTNCRCNSFTFDKLEFIRTGLGEDYEIKLEKTNEGVLAKLIYVPTKEALIEEPVNSAQLCYFENVYGNYLFASTNFDEVANKNSASMEIYSSQDGFNNLRFRADGENLFYSNINHLYLPFYKMDTYMCAVPAGKFGQSDYDALPRCRVSQDRVLKFCVMSKTELPFYDKVTQTEGYQPVTYKFALMFKDLTPPPKIDSVFAEPMEKSENKFIISWQKVREKDGSDVADLNYYKIYCNKGPFMSASGKYSVTGLKPTVLVYSNADIVNVDLGTCNGENIQGNLEYYFAVTSEDISGNEAEPAVFGPSTPADTLAPGKVILDINGKQHYSQGSFTFVNTPSQTARAVLKWEKPQNNEDEQTPLTDLAHYHIYLSASQLTALDECTPANNCVTWTANERTFNVGEKIGSVAIANGGTYYFTVAAVDSSNNFINDPTKGFIKPEQWEGIEDHIKGYPGEGRIVWGLE